MAYLILDIETIPLPPIDNEVEEAIAKKIQARIEKTGDDPENAESLIRSTSPFFGQVLCVGMRWLQDDGSTRDKVVCEENEEATLRTFFEVINHSSTQGAKFVHYNGMGLIFPFSPCGQPNTILKLPIENLPIYVDLLLITMLM